MSFDYIAEELKIGDMYFLYIPSCTFMDKYFKRKFYTIGCEQITHQNKLYEECFRQEFYCIL